MAGLTGGGVQMCRFGAFIAVAVASLGLAACVMPAVPAPAPTPSETPAVVEPTPVQPPPVTEGGFTLAELLASRGETLPAAITASELQTYFPLATDGIPDPLPVGYAYPADVPPAQLADAGGMFESSYADALALQSWHCSWLHLLANTEDEATAAAAIEHLALYTVLPQSYTVDAEGFLAYWDRQVEQQGGEAGAAAYEMPVCTGAIVTP